MTRIVIDRTQVRRACNKRKIGRGWCVMIGGGQPWVQPSFRPLFPPPPPPPPPLHHINQCIFTKSGGIRSSPVGLYVFWLETLEPASFRHLLGRGGDTLKPPHPPGEGGGERQINTIKNVTVMTWLGFQRTRTWWNNFLACNEETWISDISVPCVNHMYNDYNLLYCVVRDGAKGTMHIRGYVRGIEMEEDTYQDVQFRRMVEGKIDDESMFGIRRILGSILAAVRHLFHIRNGSSTNWDVLCHKARQ